MTTQPEAVLEANLVTQLIGLKYEAVSIQSGTTPVYVCVSNHDA